MLISELARQVGLHPETLRRLEKRGIIPAAKRDVNGWRQYPPEAVTALKELYARSDEGPERPAA